MSLVKWNKYPQTQPEESGIYVVNRKLCTIYSNVLSFFDRNTKMWYDCTDRGKIVDGINAYNPYKIIPFN